MSTKLINITLSYINDRRHPLQQALQDGVAKDFAEYQKLCGEIRGLTAVEQYLLDLAKRMEQDDDE
jgi:hypothetical protein